MTFGMQSNLSQIFRQHGSKFNLPQTDQNKQSPAKKVFSLRVSETPFVVDNKFALQLDEII